MSGLKEEEEEEEESREMEAISHHVVLRTKPNQAANRIDAIR
jgi:hypothetical protein